MKTIQLYDYQRIMLRHIEEELDEPSGRVLYVSKTIRVKLGKSVMVQMSTGHGQDIRDGGCYTEREGGRLHLGDSPPKGVGGANERNALTVRHFLQEEQKQGLQGQAKVRKGV